MQTPISNPEEGGIGGQEEPIQSAAQMKRDPNEPAEKKRGQILKYGQNKKMGAEDGQDGFKPNDGKATGTNP